jgi:hypothetical protein
MAAREHSGIALMRPPSELSTLTAAQQRTLATPIRKAAGGGGR